MTVRGKQFVGGMLMGAGAMYWLRRDEGIGGRSRGRQAEPGGPSSYGARHGDIAGLEGASLRSNRPSRVRAVRLALRALGGALLIYGVVQRRGRMGRTARRLGLRLLVPAQLPLWGGAVRSRPAASGERRRIVDVQQSVHIEAPVEQVYAFWSNYENFPLFMANLREVEDMGGGRSRWTMRGPGGAPLSWTARLTERQPNQVIAWHTEPGATVEHAGIIRFRTEGTGTRVSLRFCYRPLAGRLGQAAAELLGADPRAQLSTNLVRLKTLLEATVR